MSREHINSDVETLQCLDLFDSKPTGSQLQGCRKTIIPSEPLSIASRQMRFRIPEVNTEFTKLSSATIELTYKVATAAGIDVGAQNAFTGFPGVQLGIGLQNFSLFLVVYGHPVLVKA